MASENDRTTFVFDRAPHGHRFAFDPLFPPGVLFYRVNLRAWYTIRVPFHSEVRAWEIPQGKCDSQPLSEGRPLNRSMGQFDTDGRDVDRPSNQPSTTERDVLNSRAESLAAPLVDEPLASEFIELLSFRAGSDVLAIETRFVCEVLRNIEITPLPGNHGPLVGITNLRGEVLAVMSLVPLLQSVDAEPDLSGKWVIVVGIDRAQFGIAVGSVSEVAAIPINDILDPSRQTQISDSTLVRGVTEEACVILDGQAVLDDPRLIIEDRE